MTGDLSVFVMKGKGDCEGFLMGNEWRRVNCTHTMHSGEGITIMINVGDRQAYIVRYVRKRTNKNQKKENQKRQTREKREVKRSEER